MYMLASCARLIGCPPRTEARPRTGEERFSGLVQKYTICVQFYKNVRIVRRYLNGYYLICVGVSNMLYLALACVLNQTRVITTTFPLVL